MLDNPQSKKIPNEEILLKTRAEVIQQINNNTYDLAIIGGGIHGATAARIAASNGLKTVLLEKADYASATSSRSSKMAHGGLRYLELLDFQQVFEGVKSREKLFKDYPKSVTPHPFYIPVYKGDWWFRFKLGVGLKLYDLFLKNKARKHSWLNKEAVVKEIPELASQNIAGCYCYFDGVMKDYRLVINNILNARLEGADCLNYAKVTDISGTKLSWKDQIDQKEYTIKASKILNCAGPWVNEFTSADAPKLKYSRGSHIIFSVPWNKPALFLPMEGDTRYYFVGPHDAGTMVGTTEREVDELNEDPQASKSEIDEILARLKRDLPDSDLTKENVHYAFAGVRSLPVRNSSGNTSKLSRKHIWHQQDNIFSLFGGKLTTAEWTAREGIKLILNSLNKKTKIIGQQQIEFSDQVTAKNAFKFEQATTLEDYLRRRTGAEYHNDISLEVVASELKPFIDKKNLQKQISKYQERIQHLQNMLCK